MWRRHFINPTAGNGTTYGDSLAAFARTVATFDAYKCLFIFDFVLLTSIDPDFQSPPGQWEKEQQQREKDYVASLQSGNTGPRAAALDTSKFDVLRSAIVDRAITMDALSIFEKRSGSLGGEVNLTATAPKFLVRILSVLLLVLAGCEPNTTLPGTTSGEVTR